MSNPFSGSEQASPEKIRKSRPLNRFQRRVLGVLVEKSKTTPDVYPMTLAGITTGCNQKSNRSPLMTLNQDEVQRTLEELRGLGAVMEVQSDGRVPKFKHLMYDWMGVEKAELAVMTELLLRGQQSLGDLRARAARMQPDIVDLGHLRPVVDALIEKKLMIELTPVGRGQIVSHNLYQPDELSKVKSLVESEKGAVEDDVDSATPATPAERGTRSDVIPDLAAQRPCGAADPPRLRSSRAIVGRHGLSLLANLTFLRETLMP